MRLASSRPLLAVVLVLVAAACSDSTDGPAANGDAGRGPSTEASDAAPGGRLDAADEGGSAPPASCADGGDGAAAPSIPDAAFAWLQTRGYTCWARESAVHPSAGPHGGNVRTYMNAPLTAALEADGSRPVGATAVKELYGNGTSEVTGWALMVKTQAGTAKDSWYWYETFGTTPGAQTIEGQGKALCEGCHAGGEDYTLTPFPLR